jgi:hypothetical protein
MFAIYAGAYPSGAPFRCSPLVLAHDLTLKYYARLERSYSDKHSSLFGLVVNYDGNTF